jgi:hypothetical protein
MHSCISEAIRNRAASMLELMAHRSADKKVDAAKDPHRRKVSFKVG